MFRKTMIAAVAVALCGTAGVTLAAKGGNGGGMGNGVGGGQGHMAATPHVPAPAMSNGKNTIDRDFGAARAAEVRGLTPPVATPRIKPNRVETSATTKITPNKASKRTTANTRYHSQVRNPIPRVENAPDFRASREQRMRDAYNRWLIAHR